MSTEAHRPAGGDTGETPEEAALARVLESYLAGLEAGRPADPDRLIAAHPELAGPLRACLNVMHLAAGLGGSSGQPAGPIPADPADAGLIAPPGVSALTMLWPRDDSSHLLLPEPPEDVPPIAQVGSDVRPDRPAGVGAGRYQVLGEIARGGMGVVLRARDVDLGRDLALKVLQARHRSDPDVLSRFVEEARIGGQLQHPGIVPVHELGTFADRRPYFTMKLVKGRTLAALLAERSDRPDPSPVGAGSRRRSDRVGPGGPDRGREPPPTGIPHPTEGPPTHDDLTRFLTIFEQVCQTVAYAHARRVIHRDLKPANVMVGSFGEVQVVDWGLAKVLPEGGVADEARAMARAETEILTSRSGPAGSGGESQPGSVLGTPSYMAPEQARGELDRIDERADVFGLGAILCEILTGRPPFGGPSRDEIRARAARGDLTAAFRRLDACGVDAELVGLARDCLAAEPARRPRDAGELARRMSAYQAGVQDRLRAAELARVEAQARAEEERKRRRLTVALAASVVGSIVLAGGGWAYLARQRMDRARNVDRAASGVEFLYAEAMRAGDDPTRWVAVREAARALEGQLGEVPDAPTRDRLTALVREANRAVAGAESDRTLLAQLVDIRSAESDDPDGTATGARYSHAFREAGMNLEELPPAEAGTKLRDRPPAVRLALVAALDDWAAVRRSRSRDRAGALRLAEIARLADPDPWRNQLRARLLGASSDRTGLAALKDLVRSARLDELPAVSLQILGGGLLRYGDPTGAESVLRAASRRYPGDVWIIYRLAECLERQGRGEEAIRYYTAARSLRPETAHQLAHALERRGETDQAIAVLRDLRQLRPKVGRHLVCLGGMLKDQGRTKEARDVLDAAISALRGETEQQPGRADAHSNLGLALWHRGRLNEAIAECRAALRLRPDDPTAHSTLGNALLAQGKLDEAIDEYRAALRLKPDYPEAHSNLGVALSDQGKLDEAIDEYRATLRLKPDYPSAHANLGDALYEQGKLDEALTECRAALRLKPDLPEAHGNLGNALRAQGKLDEAIDEYRAALRLKPDLPGAHSILGDVLRAQGRLDEAIDECRAALRLEPDDPGAHSTLGLVLRSRGEYAGAIAEFRRARDLASKTDPRRVRAIERDLAATEQRASVAARLPTVLTGKQKPVDAVETLGFAQLCYERMLHAASARLWTDAFLSQPTLVDDKKARYRYNAACAAALAGCGRGKDDPPPDDAAKTHWRKQAIDWLKADLAAWSKILETTQPQARPLITQTLQHWKSDPDLAGLRDPAALDKLPNDEQAACRAIWNDVDALLARAGPTGR